MRCGSAVNFSFGLYRRVAEWKGFQQKITAILASCERSLLAPDDERFGEHVTANACGDAWPAHPAGIPFNLAAW
jgi:hypothetical protein